MVPPFQNTVYNEFVADQVLTSDNLNNLFSYLDEQGRQSRTQLTGTGITGGLQIVTTPAGSNGKVQVKITPGNGITSEGYLVSFAGGTFNKRGKDVFNARQCRYYDKFVNTAGTNNPLFELWELKIDSDNKETEFLTDDFLNDGNKIVLLFVELLEENNKNCDPSSCDEKGKKITVTIKPLLAKANDPAVQQLLLNTSGSTPAGKALLLPEMRMPKFNAAFPPIVTAADMVQHYLQLFNNADILQQIKDNFNAAFQTLSAIIGDEFNEHEFDGFPDNFSFLSAGQLSPGRILHLQYYHDLFVTLILAYEELRQATAEMVCECIPDDTAFPRHLLLGEAMGFDEQTSVNRTRFVPAAAVSCCTGGETMIRFLCRRLVMICRNFFITGVGNNDFDNDVYDIGITPSLAGNAKLSQRAIPYYFNVKSNNGDLYRNWSYEKSVRGLADTIHSHRAARYDNPGPFVINPLDYDTEPYNFFRIEGTVGKLVNDALPVVQGFVNTNALPFKVVAVSTGTPRLGYETVDDAYSFADINMQYHVVKTELLCCIKNALRYWGSLEKKDKGDGTFTVVPPLIRIGSVFTNLKPLVIQPSFIPGVVTGPDVNPGDPSVVATAPGTAATTTTPVVTTATVTPGLVNVGANPGMTVFTPSVTLTPTTPVVTAPATAVTSVTPIRNVTVSAPAFSGAASGVAFTPVRLTPLRTGGAFSPHGMKAGPGLSMRASSAALGRSMSFAAVAQPSIVKPASSLVGSNIVGSVFGNMIPVSSFINEFHLLEGINIAALPKPDPFSKTESISRYILALIDELTKLAALLDADTPAELDEAAFNDHAGKLKAAHNDLAQLLAGYHSKNYLVEKIKLNVKDHPNEIDRISAAMAILSDSDASAIITLMTNLSSPAAFISQLEAKKGSYSAQEDVIKRFYDQLDRAHMIIPKITEPNVGEDNEFDSLLEQLKKGVCLCEIDNIIYLLKKNTDQLNKLTDTHNLSVFAGEHPGLQPRAGVSSGGTFVMVYKGTNDPSLPGIAPGTVIGDFYLPYTCFSDCTPVQVIIGTLTAEKFSPTAVASASNARLFIEDKPVTVSLSSEGSDDADGNITSFKWALPEGTTGAKITSDSNKASIDAEFSQPGTYEFTLTVTDNDNKTDSASVTVTVLKKPATAVNLCGDLNDIQAKFIAFDADASAADLVNAPNFAQLYNDVRKFFKTFKSQDIQGKGDDEQIAFFVSQKIGSRLPKWIRGLSILIQDNKQRAQAYTLLNLFARLAYYIACIQGQDINDNTGSASPMDDALNELIALIPVIKATLPNTAPAQRALLSQLLLNTKDAKQVIIKKGEDGTKKIYLARLDSFIELLSGLGI